MEAEAQARQQSPAKAKWVVLPEVRTDVVRSIRDLFYREPAFSSSVVTARDGVGVRASTIDGPA